MQAIPKGAHAPSIFPELQAVHLDPLIHFLYIVLVILLFSPFQNCLYFQNWLSVLFGLLFLQNIIYLPNNSFI